MSSRTAIPTSAGLQRGETKKGKERSATPQRGTVKKLNIIYLPIEKLKLNPNNPRIHSEKQVAQIAHSIQVFGFNVPVLLDAQSRVVAGHGRVLAARMLGVSQVPVIQLRHLTAHQAQAFTIADNKLTENAVWDSRLLGEQLKSLSDVELDFSLESTGFEMAEIDILIEGLAPETDDAQDPADVLPEEHSEVSAPGDLWVLGKHRVLCADAVNPVSYSLLMGRRAADLIFTDPPYNVAIDGHATGLGRKKHKNFAMASGEMSSAEFTNFLSKVCRLVARHSRAGSIHFICMDWRHVGELLKAGCEAYNELKNICVWVKSNAGMGSLYRSQHELILVFKNGTTTHDNNVQLGQFGRYRSNVWQYAGANSFSRSTPEGNLLDLHPTTKPVAMVADAIMDCSGRGDLVLDAFLGSGTTVIAAERTGRICYGIELEPRYVDTAVRRWQAFTGLTAVHADSGRTFAEVEEEKTSVSE